MILAFDTYYYGETAKSVCLCFNNWLDSEPVTTYEEIICGISEYEPGLFYKRELPCIMSFLKKVELTCIEFVIIDGYAILDDYGKKGWVTYCLKSLKGEFQLLDLRKQNFTEILLM